MPDSLFQPTVADEQPNQLTLVSIAASAHPAVAASATTSSPYSLKTGVAMVCAFMLLGLAGCNSALKDLALVENPGPSKTFTVTAYGAKGDGLVDDAPAIGKAVTAAINAGGGEVTFPCGDYIIRSLVGDAPGNRSLLYFKNVKGVKLSGQGSCSHLLTTVAQKSVIEFEDSTNISVTALKITALNTKYIETYGMGGGAAIRFSGVTNGNISKIEVDGAAAGALYLTKGTSSTSVTSNNVHDTYGSAIWEDDCGSASAHNCLPSTPPSDNVYESNTFTNTSLYAGAAIVLDDGSGVSNAIVQNNTISWTRKPIIVSPGVHCIQVNNASGVSVLTNNCTATPWDAIVVTTGAGGKSENVTIKGNTMENSGTSGIGGSGVVIYDAPQGLGISGLTITSNSIITAADDGIRLVAASKAGNVKNAHVENNVIQMVDQRMPGTRFGIDVEKSASVTVASNSVSCNGKCIAVGVNIDASSATTPTTTSNQVVDIVGAPLSIH